MKKIVKFEIPDESYVNDDDFEQFLRENIQNWYNLRSRAEIITMPSEEEIVIKATTEGDKAAKQDPKLPEFLNHRDFSVSYGFQSGVHWLLTKIKGE